MQMRVDFEICFIGNCIKNLGSVKEKGADKFSRAKMRAGERNTLWQSLVNIYGVLQMQRSAVVMH